jgi:hypothetical protein
MEALHLEMKRCKFAAMWNRVSENLGVACVDGLACRTRWIEMAEEQRLQVENFAKLDELVGDLTEDDMMMPLLSFPGFLTMDGPTEELLGPLQMTGADGVGLAVDFEAAEAVKATTAAKAAKATKTAKAAKAVRATEALEVVSKSTHLYSIIKSHWTPTATTNRPITLLSLDDLKCTESGVLYEDTPPGQELFTPTVIMKHTFGETPMCGIARGGALFARSTRIGKDKSVLITLHSGGLHFWKGNNNKTGNCKQAFKENPSFS